MKARKIARNRRKMDEKGVSPVIGVILMVAATIVIAAVVMGMLGGFGPPKKTYMVTASASENATGYICVIYNGGPDAQFVMDLNCTISNATGSTIFHLTNETGSTKCIQGTQGPNNDHIVVAAKFKDGSTQVILDTWT